MMLRVANRSITKKLTRMNMLVSGAALLIACVAFVAYDLVTFRQAMVYNLSIQAQMAGSNSVSPLLFNDPQAAENTLSALTAAPNVISAGIYTLDGRPFATYWRDAHGQTLTLPKIPASQTETHWFKDGQLVLVRTIMFQGKPTGTVYIRSDLQEMTHRLKRYAGIAAIVLLASLIAALLVASIFQRAVAEPIVHLAEIARIVSRDKNYAMRATPTGKRDEPDILIGAFNEMLGQIQEREAALQQAHDELEQRVVERTAQLETAKKEVEEFSRSVVLAEEETRRQKELLQLILGSITEGVIVADTNGKFLLFNSAAERFVGIGAIDATPDQWSQEYGSFRPDGVSLFPPDELPLVRAMHGESVDAVELLIRNANVPDGRLLSITGRPLRGGDGALKGGVVVLHDITAQKRAEETLVRAKEQAELSTKFKDQFLSTMSHELRTPLNAVLGFSDLLADERYGPLNDRQQRYVSHIHSGGKHLLKLISDILDLSKIEAGRMELTREDVTVASAFVEVISALYPLAEKKSQALLQEVDPNLRVHADAMRFKQALMNLVGNAIKFTPEGGRIEMTARQVDEQVRIEVRDNGPGIPPEQQQRIFEAFVRLTETGSATEGTGLGLAITARLVELHGSKLGIESQPGKGTCFYFSFPFVASRLDQPVQTSLSVPTARKAPRILVIEDNAVTGQLIQSQLASSGYETLRCDKSERATEMAAEHQPDAITLDLLMQPVHGLEVLLQLKNDPRTSKIPVIVVTIVDQPGLGTALGADEYLIKPVDKATLLAAVERCLRSRGGAAPQRAILVVEDDASTLEMIVELLKAYGYAVRTAADGEQARVSVAQSLPELVILDLVLPKMSGFELLAEWRSNPRTADLSVFVLTSKDLTKEEEKYLHAHAESLFRKQNSWREPLIKQLERVVTSPTLENA